ncbi:hypothetical protein M601_013100 [Cellulophaga baltica 4]|nr:hypothetical protein M601_013100 [Cellulophaga baltica 4]
MKDFLADFGLYQEYTLLEEYIIGNQNYTDPIDFIGETFEYWCEKEESSKTFELDLDEARRSYFGEHRGDRIHSDHFIDGKLNYSFTAIGKCKSCNNYHIILVLNVFSNKPISNIIDNKNNIAFHLAQTKQHPGTNLYIQKIGAIPEIKRLPNKIITNYFDRETNKWYYKGISALDKNFGIGSLAYFRRIIEKELIHIVESIKLLPDSHTNEIQKLLNKHNANPKVSTIYDNIFEFLPNSLKVIGDNPIKLLYNQTSDGLHSLTEKECLEKSGKILKLLEFVVKKIYEERSEIKELKDTIKGLK